MKMTRYFFISTDLDDLERFEEELERAGIVTPQIHVLTENEGDADQHPHIHQVTPFMKKDVVRSALIGAAGGLCLAVLAIVVTALAGWHLTDAGWVPFIFLALVLLGFCTWLGGFRGIQSTNAHTQRFDDAIKEGKHVFFVDVAPDQGKVLEETARNYSTVETAGRERGAPSWIVFSQHRIKRFFTETFP